MLQFLEEEPGTKHRAKYRYHVETMRDGSKMFIERPTWRGAFDFKVVVEDWSAKGTHAEIRADLLRKKTENPKRLVKLIQAIEDVHACKDPDEVLSSRGNLSFRSGWESDLLLKLLKWFFILEDVYYWNYGGRDTLMSFIHEAAGE